MRPVKVTLITKDTISIGVERAPEWGNGLLTVPSEPIHAALWRAPLAAIRSQLGKRPERPNNEISGRRTNKVGNCGIPGRAVPI